MKKINTSIRSEYTEDINDEDWCCLVVMLVENNSNFTHIISDFEEAAASNPHPAIVNIRSRNLMSTPTRRDASMIRTLKTTILNRKRNDLKKVRDETRRPQSNGSGSFRNVDSGSQMPTCGPICYFVITEIHDPYFPNKSLEEGIPLVAVVEITDASVHVRSTSEHVSKYGESTIHYLPNDPVNLNINNFWTVFFKNYADPNNLSLFSHTILTTLSAHEIQHDPSERTSMTKKGQLYFELIKTHLFSLARHVRNYTHFVASAKIIDPPSAPQQKSSLALYNTLLDNVPSECVSVELLLHCLLEQVEFNISPRKDESTTSRMTAGGVKSILSENLDRTTLGREGISTCSLMSKTDPKFVNHTDKISIKTNHFSHPLIDLEKIHINMYTRMPYSRKLTQCKKQEPGERARIASQLQKVYNCIDIAIDRDTFFNCLHLMYFDSFFRSSSESGNDDFEGLITPSLVPESFEQNDKPTSLKSKRETQLQALEKILTSDERLNKLFSTDTGDFFSFCYIEKLSRRLLLQALNNAYFKFTNFDSYYNSLTDSMLIWFQNPAVRSSSYRMHKEGSLLTSIGFKDFFYQRSIVDAMLAKKIQEDIRKEDDKRKASWMARNIPGYGTDSCNVEDWNISVPFPLVSFLQERSGKNLDLSVYSSLGQDIIKVSESKKIVCSFDGAVMTVKRTKWLPVGEYCTTLLSSHGLQITHHSVLKGAPRFVGIAGQATDSAAPDNNNFDFHIETKHGIMFALHGEYRNVSQFAYPEDDENSGFSEESYVLDLSVSLPNGLKIELLRGRNNYLKQTYLTESESRGTVNEEDYRIFLRDGTVLIFMKNASVIVLYPNATETRIKVFRDVRPYTGESDNVVIHEIFKHEVICPNGEFLRFVENKEVLREEPYRLRVACENTIGLFTERSDGTKSFLDAEGTLKTVFPDQTTTTSRPYVRPDSKPAVPQDEDDKEERFNEYVTCTTEHKTWHPKYVPVMYRDGSWTIDLPFRIRLVSASPGSVEMRFEKTRVLCKDGVMKVDTENPKDAQKLTRTKFIFDRRKVVEDVVCSMADSNSKILYVLADGSASLSKRDRNSRYSTRETKRMGSSSAEAEEPMAKSVCRSSAYFMSRDLKYDTLRLERGVSATPPEQPHKRVHRFFVMERDFSGYEFVHEEDNARTVRKYHGEWGATGYGVRSSGGLVTCQRPLYKTWPQRLEVARKAHPLLGTGFLRSDLSPHVPLDKVWLFDLARPATGPPRPPCMPYRPRTSPPDEICFVTRCVKNVLHIFKSIPAQEIFRAALKKYEESNRLLIDKYRDQWVPNLRTESEILEAEEVFERCRKYFSDGAFTLEYIKQESPNNPTLSSSSTS